MSEGRVFEGYCHVAEVTGLGMITIRCDFGEADVAATVRDLTGCDIPAVRRITADRDRTLLWMAPDELLLVLPRSDTAPFAARLAEGLARFHSLVVDLSDARTMFEVSGPACREVLAKLAPVDVHPDAFGPGDFRRTRLAQVPVAFWMASETSFRVVCFRSVSVYVRDVLSVSAGPGGEVGYPRPI